MKSISRNIQNIRIRNEHPETSRNIQKHPETSRMTIKINIGDGHFNHDDGKKQIYFGNAVLSVLAGSRTLDMAETC